MNKNKPEGTVFSVGFNRKLPVFLTPQSVKLIHGRDKVLCGGCTNGMIKIQREDSRYDMIPHENCKGLGYRIDKKFGRPMKRLANVGSRWVKAKRKKSKGTMKQRGK